MLRKQTAPTYKTKQNWFKQHKGWTAVIVLTVVLSAWGSIASDHPDTQNTASDSSGSSSSGSEGTIPISNGTPADTYAQPQPPTCTTYQAIDSQTWLEIVKDPDSYTDQCYVVYGEVTQFDAATGTSGFRANVGGVEQTPSYGFVGYPTNTALVGDPSVLSSVVEQDLFTANVMVLGSYSYATQIGGQTTVPQLQVDSITVTGTVSD